MVPLISDTRYRLHGPRDMLELTQLLYGETASLGEPYQNFANPYSRTPNLKYEWTQIRESKLDEAWAMLPNGGKNAKLMVEVGSFIGRSSVLIGQWLRSKQRKVHGVYYNAVPLLCIDTWLGDLGMTLNQIYPKEMGFRNGQSTLYHTWLLNIISNNLTHHVLPLVAPSLLGARVLDYLRRMHEAQTRKLKPANTRLKPEQKFCSNFPLSNRQTCFHSKPLGLLLPYRAVLLRALPAPLSLFGAVACFPAASAVDIRFCTRLPVPPLYLPSPSPVSPLYLPRASPVPPCTKSHIPSPRLLASPVSVDVLYLDSAHEMRETFVELSAYYPLLKPGGLLIGDDFNWKAVSHDAQLFARVHGLELSSFDGCHQRLRRRGRPWGRRTLHATTTLALFYLPCLASPRLASPRLTSPWVRSGGKSETCVWYLKKPLSEKLKGVVERRPTLRKRGEPIVAGR